MADLRKQGIVTKVRTLKTGATVGGIPFRSLGKRPVRFLSLMECCRNTPGRYVRKIAPPWSHRSPAGAVGSMNLSPSKGQPWTASPSESGAASAR